MAVHLKRMQILVSFSANLPTQILFSGFDRCNILWLEKRKNWVDITPVFSFHFGQVFNQL